MTPELPSPDAALTTPRVGVDTGGTFTDFVHLDAAGKLTVHKLRSTPANPAAAILQGIADLTSAAAEITHGSTVATNAVLERKGARVALVATAGFEDVLLISRQTRPELYNFQVQARRPLIEPGMTFGIAERLAYDGSILEPIQDLPSSAPAQSGHPERSRGTPKSSAPPKPLEPSYPGSPLPQTFPNLIAELKAVQVQSVAVCLLHSYANPIHEQMLAGALKHAGFTVSASHEILPEYREFERWATTAVNAYVTPLMAAYLTKLQAALTPTEPRALSPEPCLRIMQSNGGSISAARASEAAVQTILSGPAAGVVGAQAMAAASGYTRIITFDMGGTSTDVSLIDQTIATTNESLVGDLPVRLPVLDIHTVGAGGGSIAFVDSGGSLRVGPRSAGADPGPACYGTGSELTVTDANLLLGRLDPAWFLGGRMTLDVARTRAIARTLAAKLGLTERALAEGMVRIANANMERAVRVVSVQRGHDPRDFALLAFGGAGGLHACDLAASLDIATVLIPEHSGVLSALGMLLADVTKDYSASVLKPVGWGGATEASLKEGLAPLLSRAQADLLAEGFNPADILLEPSLDMRYKGQAYEISIPFAPDFAEHFHRMHAKLYGYANPARPLEVVQLRVKAIGRTDKPALAYAPEIPQAPPAPTTIRKTVFGRRRLDTPIFRREKLVSGMNAAGPAIILTGQSTNVIPPGWHWKIDAIGTLVATRA
jgi:N-methylhydantoinase A/oxoprolinase/acetone carboxylase beta subunit